MIKNRSALFMGLIAGVLFVSGCSCLKKKETAPAPAAPKEEVKQTPSGLKYEVVKPAAPGAKKPEAGKKVTVNYTGWLEEGGKPGKKFDSSFDHGAPFIFTVGVGQVIKGWDEGVMMMSEGEQMRLVIPAELAYGAQGVKDTIPANANLIFDVELVKVDADAVTA